MICNLKIAVFSRGLETSLGIVVWPIFIYQLFKGNLLNIGIFASLISLIIIILNLIQSKIADDKRLKKKFVKYGSWFYSFGWFLKIFGTTTLYVFVVDIYHKLTSIFSFTSFDALVYDHIADQGHLIDEYTILKEMILHTGKAFGFLIITILSFYLSLNWLFLIGFLATLGLSLIPNSELEKI